MPGETRAEQPPDTAPPGTGQPGTGQPGTGQPGTGQPGTDQPSRGQLNAQIEECVFELTGRMLGQVERIAQRLAVPAVFIKALHTLDAPMAMKDLGKRMHCDPSFVTAIADMLEKRGLARRAAHPGDRRVKHLILTGEGCDLKQRLEAELSARMPWSTGLTDAERVQLLALIRKMLTATPPAENPDAGGCDPGRLAAADLSATTLAATGLGDADPAAPLAGTRATAKGVESSLDAAPTAS
ncbi:MAG TPA: MarR family transcriptional regulator [Streptosporangiaceae bacterium]|nr:MarR family transcriptional regulator [Streptosporangiaceae bacterium]